MASTQDLESIAEEILLATKTFSQYLKSNGQPQPSLAVDAPTGFSGLPADIQAARSKLRELTSQLNYLVTGASENIMARPHLDMDQAALRYIHHFKIPQAVPLDGDISFYELSEKTKLDEPRLRRILRYAMTSNLFCEPRVGYVAHTAESALLARDKKTQDTIGHDVEISYPLHVKLPEAIKKWGADGISNHTALNIAHNTDLPFYPFMMTHEDPLVSARFFGLLEGIATSEGFAMKHTVNGYDWGSSGGATVVDVGGGNGHASIAIAKEYPDLNFIVQDLPHVVEIGKTACPEELQSRISFEPYDFFTPQAREADIFILRFIFHNYSDRYCLEILKNLIPAVKPGAKIIVIDGIMPEPKTLPRLIEKGIRFMDMIQLTHLNGLEREIGDWKALLKEADPRLTIKSVNTPEGSNNSLLEIVLDA